MDFKKYETHRVSGRQGPAEKKCCRYRSG